jgi:hypothetical protein
MGTTPVLPFAVFGLHYDKDVVIQTNDPSVDMLEIIMLKVPPHIAEGGEVWFAKTSAEGGVQSLFSHLPEMATWMPGVNAPRFPMPEEFSVGFLAGDQEEEINLQFPLPDGRELHAYARFSTDPPHPRKTNSSTFNHSQDVAMALLEVSAKDIHIQASLSIGGQAQPLKRALGLIPIKAYLEQTQGGITTASMRVEAINESHIRLIRPLPGDTWAVPGEEVCDIEEQKLICRGPLATTTYHFHDGGLASAVVHQWSGEEVFRIQLDSPLPNLAKAFKGMQKRRFVADVGALKGAGIGEISAEKRGDTVIVNIHPEAPRWFAERPMRSTIHFHQDGSYSLSTVRVDAQP